MRKAIVFSYQAAKAKQQKTSVHSWKAKALFP